jgi:hypothetical protein
LLPARRKMNESHQPMDATEAALNADGFCQGINVRVCGGLLDSTALRPIGEQAQGTYLLFCISFASQVDMNRHFWFPHVIDRET